MNGSKAGGLQMQRDNRRWGPAQLAASGILVAVLLTGIVGPGTIATAGTCPPVQNTLKYTIVYGDVAVDGQAAVVGTVVEARNGDGVVAGCSVVTTAGSYGAMYVYGEDTSVDPPIPGMRDNEVIASYVNGVEATATPQQTWSNDKASHPVDLSAAAAGPPCYDFNNSGDVDIGDVGMIAGAWRATDADSLDRYNYNGNSFVDIKDIMTVAEHLGEPCP